ncbi:hypothetical protein PQE20_17645 [Vibrio harveyi]|uniref:hypothetical protein n=1 Tax=Vibrio harveyi TaxID=669 RepID=UPI00234CDF27|nr:hypothetical protein [Vibrio harveyi]WCP83242.1 hypothetical protein PQE20_17645 [Vibrio harveyi]
MNELDFKIINSIRDWKKGKRLKYDTIFMQSKISSLRNVVSKTKGTTKIKNLTINGVRQKYVMIDCRLVNHILKEFENDSNFRKRFLKNKDFNL